MVTHSWGWEGGGALLTSLKHQERGLQPPGTFESKNLKNLKKIKKNFFVAWNLFF